MRQRLLLFFATLVLCIVARAESTTEQVIDGLKYIIHTDENYAVVTANNYTQSEIVIPASIAWNAKKYPVTELGAKCFWGCTRLSSITIPSSVTSIGDGCFAYCSLVNNIIIPSSVTSLPDDCFLISGLTSITIPSSVTSIGKQCFLGCSKLKSINIPSSVTSLGEWCFYNCTGLTSITIPSSVTSLGNGCFEDCYSLFSVEIKSPSITLGHSCFASTAIDDFTIMATTPPEITGDCFYKCNTNLAKLIVPKASINKYSGWGGFGSISAATDFKQTTAYLYWIDGLKYIIYTDRGYAVLIADNYNQSEINIPASILFGSTEYPVREIAGGCFEDCYRLFTVTIPSSVTKLGDRCFEGCTRLVSVNIPESVTSLPDECFSTCYSLASIDIPSSVTSLGDNCFDNCWSLTSIKIPSSVTSLGAICFAGSGLTSITIPSSVTSLEVACFSNCKDLAFITIPSSVANIEYDCFENCSNLQTIYISPKEIYDSKSDSWHFSKALSDYKDKLKPYIQFVTTDGTPYKYGTLCLRSQVFLKEGTCENMDEAYTVKSITNGSAVLAKVTTGELEPGVAYIVANSNHEGLTIPNGAYFTLSDGTGQTLTEPVKSTLLQGTFEDTYAPAGSYVLQPDGTFHIVAQNNTIKVGAYKAYLNVPGADNAPALSLQLGGEATGIDGITETKKETDPYLYDLMGRRVTTPQKGQIYIRSGKKVLY